MAITILKAMVRKNSTLGLDTFSPQMDVDADVNANVPPQSPLDSHVDSFLNFRSRFAAFQGASAHSHDETIPIPESALRREEDEVTTVSEQSNENLPETSDIVAKDKSHCCLHCERVFKSAGHLRQHVVVHTTARRTCSTCGLVLGTTASRRVHERKHRETDSERENRLRKAKVARERSRTDQA